MHILRKITLRAVYLTNNMAISVPFERAHKKAPNSPPDGSELEALGGATPHRERLQPPQAADLAAQSSCLSACQNPKLQRSLRGDRADPRGQSGTW